MKKRIVIKLSGSVFGETANKKSLMKYAKLLKSIGRKMQIVVVAGGGYIARYYINLARELGVDEASLDELGIEVSRLNAQLFVYALGDAAYPHIPKNLHEIVVALETGKIVVAGGLHPGQSTNATSAQIAEKIDANMFINATDVAGIYNADPNKYKNAKLFRSIGIHELQNMIVNESTMAGAYDLMDIVALKVIERSKLTTRVIKSDPSVIKRAAYGHNVGTIIIT
ncbi:MAG: UMP kinase [Thaumarchaeota archaeon]|nr:UMP kinase [Nitrososphaerota archaeon]